MTAVVEEKECDPAVAGPLQHAERIRGQRPRLQQIETVALHAGTAADPVTGAMLTPIYQTTTYRQEAVGKDKGFKYSRSGNPTVSALQRRPVSWQSDAASWTKSVRAIRSFPS